MLRLQAAPNHCLHSPVPSTSSPARGGSVVLVVYRRCAIRAGAPITLRYCGPRRDRRRRGVAGAKASGMSIHEPSDEEEKFLEASILVPETVRHYNLLQQGLLEQSKWHSHGQMHHLSILPKAPGSVGLGFLHGFQSPTIFLKISCDVDLLLPVVVGEFAIERFLESLAKNGNEGCPSQLHFLKNLVGALQHEVKMVQITKRVLNTYHANIIISKPAERAIFCVDSRPSDAISIANILKVPIFVSKDIVFKDAIKILSGTWRNSSAKTVYDVILDSAIEGHDDLSEELDFLRKMNMACNEERYRDAATWRDRLRQLRKRKQDF